MSPDFHFLVLLRSVLMLAVGSVPVFLWKHRHRTAPAVLALGGAAWVIAVASKVAWALPLNAIVRHFLERQLGTSSAKVAFSAYLGLLSGVFEVGLVLVASRTIRRLRAASSADAIGFGLAFGGVEAAILALAGLAALAHPQAFPVASLVTGPLERASALVLHVVTCVLVFGPQFRARPWRAFALSFFYKSGIDAIAAYGLLELGIQTSTLKLVAFEAVIALLVAPALFIGRRTSPTMPAVASADV